MCFSGQPPKSCGGRRFTTTCKRCRREVTVSHGAEAARVDKDDYLCVRCRPLD